MKRVLKQEQIETIREVLILLAESGRLTRKNICGMSGVTPAQFDNFTKKTPDARRYKSISPSDGTLLKFIKFIRHEAKMGNQAFIALDEQTSAKVNDVISWHIDARPAPDHLFNYLRMIRVADEDACRKICNALHGNFYAYRRARENGYLVKSFLRIKPFSISDKTPRFVNIMSNETGEKRYAEGQIVDLGESLALFGFVSAEKGGEWIGVKCIIVSRPSFQRVNRMSGLFISKGEGCYHFGRIVIVRTQDTEDNMDIGTKRRRQVRGNVVPDNQLVIDVDGHNGPYLVVGRLGEL